MANKKSQLYLSVGLMTRLFGGFIMTLSMPFLVINPSNTVAWIFFSIGGGLLSVGGTLN